MKFRELEDGHVVILRQPRTDLQVVVERPTNSGEVNAEDRVVKTAHHRQLSLVSVLVGNDQDDISRHLAGESCRDQQAAVLLDLGIPRDDLKLEALEKLSLFQYDSWSGRWGRCGRLGQPETGKTE